MKYGIGKCEYADKEDKNFEKWFNSYEQTGALIFSHKEKDKEQCEIKIAGKNLEVLYAFEEIVRELNKKIDKEILKFVFETGLEDQNVKN